MAFVFQFNQLPCKTLSLNPPQPQLIYKPSIFSIGSIGRAAAGKLAISARPSFKVRAEEDDEEICAEPYDDDPAVAVAEKCPAVVVAEECPTVAVAEECPAVAVAEECPAVAVAEECPAVAVAEECPTVAVADEGPLEKSEISKLKKTLVDLCYETDRGTRATSITRAEIVELITQLEANNPTPAPTEALSLLNGKWILAYTSSSGMFPLLSTSTLPYVKVEEISQTIDSECFTFQNSVLFSGPLATTSISTNAKFEILSPQRVHIKFEEGVIGTLELTDSIVIPENVEFLGQKIDLSSFTGIMSSVQDTASNVVKTISCQPPIKFAIPNTCADSWLLTTYLDEDLRISREDGGKVFVLLKEGCDLLSPAVLLCP